MVKGEPEFQYDNLDMFKLRNINMQGSVDFQIVDSLQFCLERMTLNVFRKCKCVQKLSM